MNRNTDSRCKKPISWDALFHSRRPLRSYGTDWRCPNCRSSDLKKVSLLYQEGVARVTARTRFHGLLFGNNGLDMVFGTTVTRGELQTDLASWLRPPKKWSYLKLFGWSVVVSFVALIVYVHSVMQSSGMASSLPVRLYVLIPTMIFFVLLMLFGWHNYAFLDNMAWLRLADGHWWRKVSGCAKQSLVHGRLFHRRSQVCIRTALDSDISRPIPVACKRYAYCMLARREL